MIFIDTNVPIYAAGGPHTYKEPCLQVLWLAAERPEDFLTDAEVLQELLHRYLALHRWDQGRGVFNEFAHLMRGRVEALLLGDVEAAAGLAEQHPVLSARDLIHIAVMARLRITHVVSADRGLDQVPGITRLDPSEIATWRESALP
jgi:predicted nucleic acid-binding protein